MSYAHDSSGSDYSPKIVTSTTPIASIVSVLVKDKARVVAINDVSSGCPHHYHMKPSDKDKVVGADRQYISMISSMYLLRSY